jgi:uncharacterized membrane-anchored protein YhcB (DUF1043 family)
MAVEMVIGVALLTLFGGASVGYFLGKGKDNSKRVRELEDALEASQSELADYRSEVYGQFAQTAEKFRALDRSYNDLHRQLAESSVALCGDEATPLLAGPGQSLLTEAEEEARQEKEINPAAEASEESAPEAVRASDPAQGGEEHSRETASQSEPEPEPEPEPEQRIEDDANIVVGESADVPILTDVEAGAEEANQAEAAAEQAEDETSEKIQKVSAS